MSEYRKILFSSEYLSNVQRFYGWSDEVATQSLESMADCMETGKDWRIDRMLELNRAYGLRLVGGEGGVALEAGFGTGSLTIAARRQGINIIGIDYTANYLRVARELAAAAGFADQEIYPMLRRGDVENLQFTDDYFDLITSSGVFQFVGDLLAGVREMLRVLKPGGILMIDVPDSRYPFEAQYNIPWIPFMKKETARAWVEGFEKPLRGLDYLKYVSLPHCLGLLRCVGFEIVEAQVTTAEAEIPGLIDAVLLGRKESYLQDDPEEAFVLARRLKSQGFKGKSASFFLCARKPRGGVYPGCY